MVEVLQRWGQQKGEVRYLLRHQRAPGGESGEKHLSTITDDETLIQPVVLLGHTGLLGGKATKGSCSCSSCLEGGEKKQLRDKDSSTGGAKEQGKIYGQMDTFQMQPAWN